MARESKQADGSTLSNLTTLGLTRYEAAVYLALLERQDFTPPQLATCAQVPRQRIYDVLASLCDRGLALERRSGKQRLFQAVAPATGLAGLLHTRQQQYEQALEQQRQQTEQMVAALGPLYEAGHRNQDPLAYVEVLSDPARIAERGELLAQGAERSICSFFTAPSLLSYETGLTLVRSPLERGLSYRTIYENNVWQDPGSQDFIRQCQDWGQDIRFVESVPFKLQLFDERGVLLSLQDPLVSTPSFTALSITHPGLAMTLKIAFESLWMQGTTEPPAKA